MKVNIIITPPGGTDQAKALSKLHDITQIFEDGYELSVAWPANPIFFSNIYIYKEFVW